MNIYINIEIKKREYNSRMLLALIAVEEDFGRYLYLLAFAALINTFISFIDLF